MRYIAHAFNGCFRGKINCHGRNVGFIEIDKTDNSGNRLIIVTSDRIEFIKLKNRLSIFAACIHPY
jgi:hypothetical protein